MKLIKCILKIFPSTGTFLYQYLPLEDLISQKINLENVTPLNQHPMVFLMRFIKPFPCFSVVRKRLEDVEDDFHVFFFKSEGMKKNYKENFFFENSKSLLFEKSSLFLFRKY